MQGGGLTSMSGKAVMWAPRHTSESDASWLRLVQTLANAGSPVPLNFMMRLVRSCGSTAGKRRGVESGAARRTNGELRRPVEEGVRLLGVSAPGVAHAFARTAGKQP